MLESVRFPTWFPIHGVAFDFDQVAGSRVGSQKKQHMMSETVKDAEEGCGSKIHEKIPHENDLDRFWFWISDEAVTVWGPGESITSALPPNET
mmetsp:Transcript_4297/g.9661  ORF Transcript_4297/g.9661 Transcript_4297/m.9661 type:complete len:93 (+) Transcript_4297:225-503(+)